MAYDEQLKIDVLKHADIVKVVGSYLPLVKKGKDYLAKCPFHDDTNPSMHVSPEKQMFKCFVCGTGGGPIYFVQKIENLSYFDALKKVAEICDYHDPRLEGQVKSVKVDPRKEALLKCLSDLTLYYEYALSTDEGEEGLKYFESRNLDADIRNKYKLGYAFKDGAATIKFLNEKRGHSFKTIEDTGVSYMKNGEYVDKNQGRVIFPLCDKDGNVIGYSARRIHESQESKYVNSPETYLFNKSSVLYNYHIAKEKAKIDKFIYLVEGFMDVFALSKIGIDSAVAVMGTALTNEHVALLRALNVEVRICLDGDKPGQDAIMKAALILEKAQIPFRIVDNQGSDEDPDEILNSKGPEALKEYLNKLISRIEFTFNYYKRTNPLQSIEEKKALIKEFLPILLNINSRLELDNYLIKLANVTGFEIDSLRNLLERARSQRTMGTPNQSKDKDVVKAFNPEAKLLRRLEMAEKEMLYQMLYHKSAIEFYEKTLGTFYDPIYRSITNYLIDYAQHHDEVDPNELLSTLEDSDIENKEDLFKTITSLCFEKNHPNYCNNELLMNLYDSIQEEKEKITNHDNLERALEGKSELEKARIIANYNKMKMKKEKEKNGGD